MPDSVQVAAPEQVVLLVVAAEIVISDGSNNSIPPLPVVIAAFKLRKCPEVSIKPPNPVALCWLALIVVVSSMPV